jgi:hypothetical protein
MVEKFCHNYGCSEDVKAAPPGGCTSFYRIG